MSVLGENILSRYTPTPKEVTERHRKALAIIATPVLHVGVIAGQEITLPEQSIKGLEQHDVDNEQNIVVTSNKLLVINCERVYQIKMKTAPKINDDAKKIIGKKLLRI